MIGTDKLSDPKTAKCQNISCQNCWKYSDLPIYWIFRGRKYHKIIREYNGKQCQKSRKREASVVRKLTKEIVKIICEPVKNEKKIEW